jgi:arylsulfatase A-like enzyme
VVANHLLTEELGLMRGFQRVEQHEADEEVVRVAAERIHEGTQFLFVNLLTAHSPYYPNGLGPVSAEDVQAQAWTQPYRSGPGLSLFSSRPTGVELFARGELEIPSEGLALLDDLYSGEVVEADRHLNTLMQAWTSAHPDGLVLVTSDHGEHLGEQRLIGHCLGSYSASLHVPMVLAGPGVPVGRTVDTPAQLEDAYGTLLELTGVAEAELSLARPESVPADRDILAATWVSPLAQDIGGRHDEGWRMLRRGRNAVVVQDDEVELFDLSEDPLMLRDLAAEQPTLAAELAQAARRAIPMDEQAATLEIDPQLAAELEALGYVQ